MTFKFGERVVSSPPFLSQRNFEVYEGENAGLVFSLTHPGSGDSLVFCAEDDNVCEKWVVAIGDAVRLDRDGNEEDDNDAKTAATTQS